MLLRIQRNGKELLGSRITHFELLHMLSLHDRHVVCCKAGVKQMGNTNQHNTCKLEKHGSDGLPGGGGEIAKRGGGGGGLPFGSAKTPVVSSGPLDFPCFTTL